MAADKNTPVELAHRALMERPDGLPPTQLARAALRLKGSVPLELAQSLLLQSLAHDSRFEYRENGRWFLADTQAATPLDNVLFTVLDVETTGGLASYNRVIEVGAFQVSHGRVGRSYMSLINPGRKIPIFISHLTNIYDEHVADAPRFEQVAADVRQFIGDSVFVGHNAPFDFRFMNMEFARAGQPLLPGPAVCTIKLARRLMPELTSRSLGAVCRHLDIELKEERHRAHGDAWATALVLLHCLDLLRAHGIHTFEDFLRVHATAPARLRKYLEKHGRLLPHL